MKIVYLVVFTHRQPNSLTYALKILNWHVHANSDAAFVPFVPRANFCFDLFHSSPFVKISQLRGYATVVFP